MKRTSMLVGDVGFSLFDPFNCPEVEAAPGVILIEDVKGGGYGLSRSSCLKTRVGRIRAGILGGVLEHRYPTEWQPHVRCWYAVCSRKGRGYITPKAMQQRIEGLMGDQILTLNLLKGGSDTLKMVRFTHLDTGQYFILTGYRPPRTYDLLARLSKRPADVTTKLGKFLHVYGSDLNILHFSTRTIKLESSEARLPTALRGEIAKLGLRMCLSHDEFSGKMLTLI